MKGTPVALWGLRLLQGNSYSVIMLIFHWFFCCTVLVEGPLEHQTLHYGTTHCSMLAFCLNALSFCLRRGALTTLWFLQLLSSFYIYRAGEVGQVKKIWQLCLSNSYCDNVMHLFTVLNFQTLLILNYCKMLFFIYKITSHLSNWFQNMNKPESGV